MSETVTQTPVAANGHAGKTGEILQITGPVVDVQFPPDMLPEIYNALHVTKEDGSILTLRRSLTLATTPSAR